MKLIPEKERYKKTINAGTADINSLYKISILAKLSLHFEKKLFNKEKEFLKDLHSLHQKTFKTVKSEWGVSQNSTTDFIVYTIDNIPVELKSLIKLTNGSRTTSEIDDVHKEIQNLCYKHDKNRQFKIIPVLEKIFEEFYR